MKILCPVDFSEASMNAYHYALEIGNLLGVSMIEVTHCQSEKRKGNFGDLDSTRLLEEKLARLKQEAERKGKITIETSLFKGHPVDVYPAYLKTMRHELVVVGTKGLTPVRDMTIGSFTEDLIFSLDCPILVIPEKHEYRSLSTVVLAIDSEPIGDSVRMPILGQIISRSGARFQVVHVNEGQEKVGHNLRRIDKHLPDISYDFESVSGGKSVTKELERYCLAHGADLLSMVHRDRGWMINLFHKSKVKEELFHLKTPLLVLPE